ncbi:MAG TPA: hemolysin family protein [Fervidobacterium sp.]|nr:HlyC/CorC family transporter [Fervidobacterium sp.]HOK87592.1 hemolysin family protein [Fervidobacterium sp.]HOM73810.1 hemolysin family protein [Fervidobacterium sp.]HOQ39521.1 hemolysin family protein [Fervidobacterium sp.]HPP17572.1 hemolysin family protein [Fervidobacterium sp.]
MEDPLSYLWNILAIVFLLMLSAFFSASETALTSVSRFKLRNLVKNKESEEEMNEIHVFNKFLTALLISNNLVNILASSIAAVTISKLITSPSISALVSTLVMTFILLIFAEITPKILARQNSERFFEFSSKIIALLSKLLSPFITMFVKIANLFVKLFGGHVVQDAQLITIDDIVSYLEMGREEGSIDHEEGLMIQRTIAMDETLVKEIMIPRVDVVAVEEMQTIREVTELIMKEEYSRVPVYRETIDNIIGICYAKDLLSFIASRGTEVLDKVRVKELMRTPLFVPEVMPVSELLKEIKTRKMHMAIVVDEYGGTAGIVTLEDILEEIFGEIMDEYDEHETMGIKKIDENSYLVDATIALNDIERELRIDFPEGEFETLAGYLLDKFHYIPRVGEQIVDGNITYKIVAASRNRIDKVLVSIEKIEKIEKNERIEKSEKDEKKEDLTDEREQSRQEGQREQEG